MRSGPDGEYELVGRLRNVGYDFFTGASVGGIDIASFQRDGEIMQFFLKKKENKKEKKTWGQMMLHDSAFFSYHEGPFSRSLGMRIG